MRDQLSHILSILLLSDPRAATSYLRQTILAISQLVVGGNCWEYVDSSETHIQPESTAREFDA